MRRLKAAGRLLRDTFFQWYQDNVVQMAAALAFYSLFSLLPGVLIVIAMANVILGKGTTENQVIDSIRAVAGAETAAAIFSLLGLFKEVSSGIPGIGVLALLVGATAVFADLQSSLNTIWRATAKTQPGVIGILTRRLWSFLMVLGIGFFVIASLAATAAISALTRIVGYRPALPPYLGPFLHGAGAFIAFTVLFALVYKLLPDARIMWSDVWIGAAVTAFLFVIGQWVVGWYLANRLLDSKSGRAGTIVAFLLWIYFSAQLFFFGAEFTHVYAEEFGSRIVPGRRGGENRE